MERNTELERVAEIFVGHWALSLTNMWWLDDPTTVTSGAATGEWLGDSFVRLRAELGGEPTWEFVFGRNDARDQFVVLYHDERGVLRVFELSLDGGSFVMSRTDPDFHQRLVGRVEGDRIVGQADASDDQGATWRKDFDMIFERAT
ncbi:MAG TPA: hypothetical protein VNO51_04935 [Ilumatobacteraceae bacterium]|nr:hypothetical protein [Ilumatobacteraceae bacterium]